MSIEDIAAKFARDKAASDNRDTVVLKQDALKDARFQRLREELNALFTDKVDALNQDTRVGNILSIAVGEEKILVSRNDREEALVIKFDTLQRKASAKYSGAVKVDKSIVIRFQPPEYAYLYSMDCRREVGNLADDKLGYFVEQALQALLS